MGIEFAGDIPFKDVYVHPVVQAADGRRMSKSLGTGIDPLDEIDVHGADALRFGLLAMASTQDVRYSADRVQQGRDLANKMWNASRLVLLNSDASPEPRTAQVEDRWILSRLQAQIAAFTAAVDAYDFSHAVLGFYEFFWSEFCDWYLEIVKPRLYDGDDDAAANLLFVLDRVLRLAHPVMPFVTEEIWSYLPDREGLLVVADFPVPSEELRDEAAEAEVAAAIEWVRQLRRWRDLIGVPAGKVLAARIEAGVPEFVPRLARVSSDGAAGEPLISVGPVEVVDSEVDREEAETRVEAERSRLRGEVERAERQLANRGFVDNAPPDVVDETRSKLDEYRRELEALA
jgi:valyl-tRNA synthetase